MGQQSSQAVGLSGDGTSTRTLPDGSVETTTTQNGRVVEVRITGIPGQAFTSVDTLFGSDGKPTSVTRAGYRGAPYVETVATYGSTGSIAQIAFLTAGGATYSTLTYAADGSFSVDHAGITGQAYTDLTNTYTSAGMLSATRLTGFKGTSYDTQETGYQANGHRFEDVFLSRGLVSEVKSVGADGKITDTPYNIAIGTALTNSGTLEKAATADQWTILPNINNTGVIDDERGSLLLIGDVANTGTLKVGSGARFDLDGALSGNGNVTLQGEGSVFILGDGGSGSVTFADNAHATLHLDTPSEFMGRIAGFGAHSQIELQGFSGQSVLAYAGNQDHTGGTLTVADGSKHVALAFAGSYTSSDFAQASDPSGSLLLKHS